mmetsp:Transcript_25694/g.57580  ORF Transcript_25694/g.57580 Transcript_25694/m.57580 type:complete len:350 (-) Transcript_25694:753-1802(-)
MAVVVIILVLRLALDDGRQYPHGTRRDCPPLGVAPAPAPSPGHLEVEPALRHGGAARAPIVRGRGVVRRRTGLPVALLLPPAFRRRGFLRLGDLHPLEGTDVRFPVLLGVGLGRVAIVDDEPYRVASLLGVLEGLDDSVRPLPVAAADERAVPELEVIDHLQRLVLVHDHVLPLPPVADLELRRGGARRPGLRGRGRLGGPAVPRPAPPGVAALRSGARGDVGHGSHQVLLAVVVVLVLVVVAVGVHLRLPHQIPLRPVPPDDVAVVVHHRALPVGLVLPRDAPRVHPALAEGARERQVRRLERLDVGYGRLRVDLLGLLPARGLGDVLGLRVGLAGRRLGRLEGRYGA